MTPKIGKQLPPLPETLPIQAVDHADLEENAVSLIILPLSKLPSNFVTIYGFGKFI